MNKDLSKQPQTVKIAAKSAKEASTKLARISAEKRNETLELIAARLEEFQNEILEANKLDVSSARQLVSQGKLSEALAHRLELNPIKIADLLEGIRSLATAEDPLGKTTLARELDSELELFRISCPIGVIGVIFESRPDALPQIASLCIKSGNACILKGGSEAHHSNQKLFELISRSIADCGLPDHTISLLQSRQDIDELLQADGLIDLIIPRGSNKLVEHIQRNTRIPVLGHAEGICHIYVDKKADLQKAIRIILDAKIQYPAACNAVETLLVHKIIANDLLPILTDELLNHKVVIKADPQSIKAIDRKEVIEAEEEDWSREYSDLILSIKVVDSIDEAIDHINLYGSGHTDCIVTEDTLASQHFFDAVNSAGVFTNASTRFADGFRYGFGAEVGISTGKLHPRGPVGLDGLVTYKYKLMGHGHIVQDYVGTGARKFTHRDIKKTERPAN